MTNPTLQNLPITNNPVLLLALELSNANWKLCFGDGSRRRTTSVPAGDFKKLEEQIALAKKKFGLPAAAPVRSVYEAGRDGFWIHRRLVEMGIDSMVIDSASIEVNRRKRKVKTDRVDVEKLLDLLRRFHFGEREALRIVRVPTVAQEDERRPLRNLQRLKKERTGHTNRIRGLLCTIGIKLNVDDTFIAQLADNPTVPAHLRAELVREKERLNLVASQISALEEELKERAHQPSTATEKKVAGLMALCGVGWLSAWVLVVEFFGWRSFRNRRELASLAGLTPTPFDSGEGEREQGISKAGNKRVRQLLCEISWGWLRWQPDSKDTLWFLRRFGEGKRARRIGIVALCRRLLIGLWRFIEQGVIPEGARIKKRRAA